MSNEKLDCAKVKKIADFLTKTENPHNDYVTTKDALVKKWGIDFDTFYEIANSVSQMLNYSPFSKELFIETIEELQKDY